MTSNSVSGGWMGGGSPVRLSASIPGLEDDPKWRPTTSCPSPSSNEQSLMKDGGFASSSSFSKGMLDEEWYMAPDNSLMDEMKELSYASSLASQKPDSSVSSAQFNLDSPHLQSFLSRSVGSRPFSCSLDSRPSLPAYLDGGGGITFDRSGGSGLASGYRHPAGLGGLGGSAMLDVQAGSCDGLASLLHGNRSSGGLPLNNPSTRGGGMGDGGFSGHSLGGSLSSILNNSFANVGGASLGNAAAPLGSNHGLGAAVTRVGSNGGGFCADQAFNSVLSGRNLLGASKDQSGLLSSMERPAFRSMNLLSTPPQPESATNSTCLPSICPPQGQTLYQKRAALRHSGSGGGLSPPVKSPPHVFTSHSNDSSVDMPDEESPTVKGLEDPVHAACMPPLLPVASSKEEIRRPPKPFSGPDKATPEFLDAEQRVDQDDEKEEDDMDESGDGSGVLYETDDTLGMEGGGGAGLPRGVLCGERGKGKKGLPAKNLMAERRRRKKLNDRLYMLRSVVPKITKMDRASILGDAIEYLKELLQRINDLNTELENTPPAERPTPSSPPVLPPTSSSLPCLVKEEPPASLPNPEAQPARVEVRSRDGKLLNIHMFCPRSPGLLLSTMRALDGLGLDVQQAVISCFNGFALDVFKAEQSREGEVGPDEIRSVLLHTARANSGTLQ